MRVVPKIRNAVFMVALITLIGPAALIASDSGNVSTAKAPLSADQVVDNLIRRNQERAQALLHSEATRVYRLVYQGFPGDREAEMTVEATYDRPSSKEFKVLSQSGSKLVVNRVFKKLLDGEKEAAQPAMSAKTQLNRDNYTFEFVRYEPSKTGGQYVLRVNPKSNSKYVYRGQVWVDGTDFAVTRIEAEKSEIHHEYTKVLDFWLPAKNESVSYIRLGGHATLTIEYKDYRVIGARHPDETPKAAAANQ
jgi:hypothetical protein